MYKETKEKQVIVVAKYLNMRKGKMVAQGAHASMKVIVDRAVFWIEPPLEYGKIEGQRYMRVPLTEEMYNWLTGMFTKVCVSVSSEEELLEIYEKAKAAGVPCSLIVDSGLTEFNGVHTKTVVSIGPDLPERIDPITGHLPLL